MIEQFVLERVYLILRHVFTPFSPLKNMSPQQVIFEIDKCTSSSFEIVYSVVSLLIIHDIKINVSFGQSILPKVTSSAYVAYFAKN